MFLVNLLLNCQSLSKSFGSRTLFKKLSLNIFENDRVGLIGPNGSGKSTLLKIFIEEEPADSGIVAPKRGLKIGYVPQTCEFQNVSPKQILMETLADNESEYMVDMWLSKLGFTGNEPNAHLLSGGWKKRLAIAKELILSPDLLLLDEPTNHLDLEGVLWLEQFLMKEAPSYLVVSHDRKFLQQTTNRIIEIDRAYPMGLLSIDGSYDHFLEKKEEFLKGQLEQERSLKGVAKRELEWLRTSPKARTTKSQARINQAHEIFDELSDLQTRNQKRRTNLAFVGTERETRKLVVGKNLSKDIGNKTLFKNLDVNLSPGSRLGLIGSNGSGKTTLLRLIAGEINPDVGTIKRAEDLKIVYFDQHRMQISNDLTLRQALSPSGDYVTFQGESVHVNGFCKRFLFSPDILDMPVGKLSGGEKARISIANLMLQPADLLLLDEPTNDLDIPTLEILEESLQEFPGAVVLITHDRCMLDSLCNQVLVLGATEQAGFYSDYAQFENAVKASLQLEKPAEKKTKNSPSPSKVQKLSYLEKKEFDTIEKVIASREEKLNELNQRLESSEVSQNATKLQELCKEISNLHQEIEALYLRFEELSRKA